MEYLKAVLLGVVQGVTEFLPVSSSGHLVLFEELLDFHAPGFLHILFFHLGTFFATVFFFRNELARIVVAGVRAARPRDGAAGPTPEDRALLRLAGLLAVGTAVTGLLGLPLEKLISPAFESLLMVGLGLCGTAVLLAISGSRRFRSPGRTLEASTLGDALWIGAAQAAALLPGLSRSGSTIAVGTIAGLDRRAAARFSFLLSIPAIAGANLVTWLGLDPAEIGGGAHAPVGVLLVGGLAAGIAGWLSLGLLLRILGRATLVGFALYCAAVGSAAIVWGLVG